MKSIWHTPDEKPKHDERILAHTLMDDYVALYAYPVEWEMQVRAYQIDKYINLDVLLALESKLMRCVSALKHAEKYVKARTKVAQVVDTGFVEMYNDILGALKDIGE